MFDGFKCLNDHARLRVILVHAYDLIDLSLRLNFCEVNALGFLGKLRFLREAVCEGIKQVFVEAKEASGLLPFGFLPAGENRDGFCAIKSHAVDHAAALFKADGQSFVVLRIGLYFGGNGVDVQEIRAAEFAFHGNGQFGVFGFCRRVHGEGDFLVDFDLGHGM